MSNDLHIAAHYVVQNEADTIVASINGIYDHCDEILIALDENVGWSGLEIVQDNTKELIYNYNDFNNKITLFTGSFLSEHDQRNFLINNSSDHITHFLAIDGDEVYAPGKFVNLYNNLKESYYDQEEVALCVPCHVYFRHRNWAVMADNNTQWPNYHLQLIHRSRIFTALRTPNVQDYIHVDPSICHFEHYSYSKSARKIWEKINTFSHNNEFDTIKWFDEVWMPCTLTSVDLHPTNPKAFSSLFEYNIDIPYIEN